MWAGIVLFLRKLSIVNIEIDWLFRVVGPNRKKTQSETFRDMLYTFDVTVHVLRAK